AARRWPGCRSRSCFAARSLSSAHLLLWGTLTGEKIRRSAFILLVIVGRRRAADQGTCWLPSPPTVIGTCSTNRIGSRKRRLYLWEGECFSAPSPKRRGGWVEG